MTYIYYVSQVIWKYFYSTQSSGEHGTLYQLRNKLNRTNVVKKPSRDFNACDDFLVLTIKSHIIAASLTLLGMKSVKDIPSIKAIPDADNAWMKTSAERKKILNDICKELVDTFVDFSFHGGNKSNDCRSDKVNEYGKKLLGLGCFYLEFSDAIREGDGNRVLRCWRYLLPIFLGSHRTNYSCEVLNMLFQHSYELSPRLSSQLLWSRFINVHGYPGKNIPADLHMEHLNRLVKDAVKGLGANKTESAISRVGRAIGTIAPVLSKFDKENLLVTPTGIHHTASFETDVKVIVHELCNKNVFGSVSGRRHPSFSTPRNVLHAMSKEDIVSWMITRLHSHHLK